MHIRTLICSSIAATDSYRFKCGAGDRMGSVHTRQASRQHSQLLMHELARTVCTDHQCRLPTFESRRGSSHARAAAYTSTKKTGKKWRIRPAHATGFALVGRVRGNKRPLSAFFLETRYVLKAETLKTRKKKTRGNRDSFSIKRKLYYTSKFKFQRIIAKQLGGWSHLNNVCLHSIHVLASLRLSSHLNTSYLPR